MPDNCGPALSLYYETKVRPDDCDEVVIGIDVSLPTTSFFYISALVYYESETVVSKYRVLLRIDGATITRASVPKLYVFFSYFVN